MLALACASRTDDPPAATEPDAPTLDTTGCEQAPNWLVCARERELQLLAELPDVRRVGDTLFLAVPGRPPTTRIDERDEHGVGHTYLYLGASPALDAHLIELLLYEGRGFVLVSRQTGRVTSLDAQPVPAPSGSRFITASWDTEAGYQPNRVQLFRLEADSAVLEWELEPIDWGPDEPRWLDDSTAVVLRRPAVMHPDSALIAETPLRLLRRGGAWSADTTPAHQF